MYFKNTRKGEHHMSTLTTTPTALTRALVQVAETPVAIRSLPTTIVVADGNTTLNIDVEAIHGDDGVLSRIDYTIDTDEGWVFSLPRPNNINCLLYTSPSPRD